MRLYTRYLRSTGKIVGCQVCSETTYKKGLYPQEDTETLLIVGKAIDDGLHKVVHGKIVKKTAAEIKQDNPPRRIIANEDRPANISNKDLATLMKRLDDLENKT